MAHQIGSEKPGTTFPIFIPTCTGTMSTTLWMISIAWQGSQRWWTYHQGFGPFADDFPFNGLSLSHACMAMLHANIWNIYEPTCPCISWRQIQGMNQGMATPLTCISSFLFWSSPECKLQTLEPNPNRTSWLNHLIAKTNEHINPCIPVSMSRHMGKWINRHAYYICILYTV